MTDSRSYRDLGVSSAKEDVVAAARLQGEGLFPGAFCKVIADVLTGDPDTCLALHSDGAGTKALVAYLAFRETGDPAVFATLAQDALVMNTDDLLCLGARGPFVVTNTIGRHRGLIPGEAVEAIVGGYERCARALAPFGVEIVLCGGETEDVGDLVRTLVVDASAACRLRRDEVIDGSRVRPGDLIVGLASAGRARYEDAVSSGIGSNGLTLARHVLLDASYRERFPEAAAPETPAELAYRGPFALTDRPAALGMTVGEALLSPTRTYAPVLRVVLAELRSGVHGLVHCTGGGQTKCLRLGAGVRFVKDALFEPPPVFRLIQATGGLSWEEMAQVFNLGHRMELFVDAAAAGEVIEASAALGVEARVVGRCEALTEGPRLLIDGPGGPLAFGRPAA
jgi:phosphoribosylformylglycinamidine cyclo-ligase